MDKIVLCGYHFDFIEDFITKCFISKGANDEILVNVILLLFFLLPSIVTIGKNCYCIPQKHPPHPLKFFHLLNTFSAYFPIPSNNSVITYSKLFKTKIWLWYLTLCPIYYRPTCGHQEISRVGRGPAYQKNCTSWNSHAEESKASKSSQSDRSISKKTKVASGLWILRKNGSQWTGKTSERVSWRRYSWCAWTPFCDILVQNYFRLTYINKFQIRFV